MKKIAVLISGQGTNLQTIIDACHLGDIPAKIACVVSNKADAYGLVRAKQAQIPQAVFLRKIFPITSKWTTPLAIICKA